MTTDPAEKRAQRVPVPKPFPDLSQGAAVTVWPYGCGGYVVYLDSAGVAALDVNNAFTLGHALSENEVIDLLRGLLVVFAEHGITSYTLAVELHDVDSAARIKRALEAPKARP